MKCSKCGNELKGTDKFCTKCGTAVPSNLNTETLNEEKKINIQKDYKKVLLLVVVIVIICSIVVINKKPNEKDTLIAIRKYVKTTIQDNTNQKGVNAVEYRTLGTDDNNRELYEIKYKHYTSNVFGKTEELIGFCYVLTKSGKPISCYYVPNDKYSNVDEWKRENNWIDYNK